MKKVDLMIDDVLHPFYEKTGETGRKDAGAGMSDALFRLAGELSCEAINKTKEKK